LNLCRKCSLCDTGNGDKTYGREHKRNTSGLLGRCRARLAERIAGLEREALAHVAREEEWRQSREFWESLSERWVEIIGMGEERDEDYTRLLKDFTDLTAAYEITAPLAEKTMERQPPNGRPIAASEAQVADVRRRRTAGESLRGITAATGLSFRTVRTIVARAEGKDPESVRRKAARMRALARERSRRYRHMQKERAAFDSALSDAREAR
jgi:hypothetical protein